MKPDPDNAAMFGCVLLDLFCDPEERKDRSGFRIHPEKSTPDALIFEMLSAVWMVSRKTFGEYCEMFEDFDDFMIYLNQNYLQMIQKFGEEEEDEVEREECSDIPDSSGELFS
jgi:hypothetical protein